MKNLKYLVLSLFTVISLVSCVDDDNDALTGGAVTGGLVNVNNKLLTYVVGGGNTYAASGSVFQGKDITTEINVYSSFTNSVTGAKSNRVLLATLPITNVTVGQSPTFEVTFTYEDLIKDIQIGGAALPANDGMLNIGDFWSLEYESTVGGNKNNNAVATKVAVGTRYAGVYEVIESQYWNSGGLQGGNWNGGERIIESVDATIYKHLGLAYWDGNEFFFTVNNTTNVITVMPVDLAGDGVLLNSSPILECTETNGAFESIACDDTTSVAVPDNVNGKDELNFTVGYFRGVGATREFFEKLVKI
jgi:hypothetical protein